MTRPYAARRKALIALRAALKKHEEELLSAMHADMRKPRFEAYLGDIGLVYTEIDASTGAPEGVDASCTAEPLRYRFRWRAVNYVQNRSAWC